MIVAVIAALALAPGASPDETPPKWLKNPSGEDLGRVWPAESLRKGLGGRALIDCNVTLEGLLAECRVASEQPKDFGFGAAALALAPVFQFTPARHNGAAVVRSVEIPINFNLGGGSASTEYANFGHDVRLALWAPWASAPTFEDVAAVRRRYSPDLSIAGHVVMHCDLKSSGQLKQCETLTEEPRNRGFAPAARELASKFRASLQGSAAQEVSHDDIIVNLAFHFPTAREASPRYISQVDWLRTIDPDRAVQLFPDKAVAAKLATGKGIVDCVIQPTGDLAQCQVTGEEPANMGFGDAAAVVASAMRANLWTRDGQPAQGAHVSLPIRLNYKVSVPEAAKP